MPRGPLGERFHQVLLGPLEEKLHQALLKRYQPATFARMLRFRLDKDLATLATADSFDDQLFKVIQRAEKERWLTNLAYQAADFPPPDDVLQSLKVEFRDLVYDNHDGGDIYGAHVIRGVRPFIDRKSLRGALKNMCSTDGPRVLVVNGPSLIGKSYSLYLISHVSQHVGDQSVLWFDLAKLRSIEEPVAVLATKLALQLGLEVKDVPSKGQSTDTRWASDLAEWIVGIVTQRQQFYWIVFDSVSQVYDRLSHIALLPGVYDFIVNLAGFADTITTLLRIVLLDCEPDVLPEHLSAGAELESPGLIQPTDVKQFFQQLLAGSSEPADLADNVDQAVAKVEQLAGSWATNAAIGKAVATVARSILSPP